MVRVIDTVTNKNPAEKAGFLFLELRFSALEEGAEIKEFVKGNLTYEVRHMTYDDHYTLESIKGFGNDR